MTVQLSTRERFLNLKDNTRHTFEIAGITLDIKKPLVGEVLQYSEGTVDSSGTRKLREMSIVNFLIDFAYDVNTDTKIFHEDDREGLLNIPYDTDLHKIYIHVLSQLTGVNVGEAVKNSEETSSGKTA